MTEQVPPMGLDGPDTDERQQDAAGSEGDLGGPTTTGVAAVDEVLSDVARLDELPLEEHLPTFERAHDSLRSALDASGDQGGPGHGDHGGQDAHPPGDPG
jgi:hypothetical protein